MGQEPGQAARACLIATELARARNAPDLSSVYYTALLQHIGCTAYSHEAAALLGGDDVAVKAAALRTDFTAPRDVVVSYPTSRRAPRRCGAPARPASPSSARARSAPAT